MKLRRLSRNSTLTSPVKIGEASKILGISVDTLRRFEKAGKISPIYTPGGTRLYSLKQLELLKNPAPKTWHIKPERFRRIKTYIIPHRAISLVAIITLSVFTSLTITTFNMQANQLFKNKRQVLGTATESASPAPTIFQSIVSGIGSLLNLTPVQKSSVKSLESSEETNLDELSKRIDTLESSLSSLDTSSSTLDPSPSTLNPNTTYTDLIGKTIIDSGGNIYPANSVTATVGTANSHFAAVYANALYGYGPVVLGNSSSDTIKTAGRFNNDLIPSGNGDQSLGDGDHYFKKGYINTITSDTGGFTSLSVGTNFTSASTTVNLINTTTATLNIGGAATTLSIGAATGTTTINNNLSITGSMTGTLTGNADTATALAANPSDCASNNFAISIAASGNLTCSAVTYAGITEMTSANLASIISDEQGSSGYVVFSTSPTLTTPVLGVATATSINGLTITTSTGTLTIPNSKTISFADAFTTSGAYSLTLTTTGTTDVTLPTTGTLATLAGTESFSNKTFTGDTYFPSGIWSTGGNIGIGTTVTAGGGLIVNTGNVGIGTTAPGSELEVYSADSSFSGVKFSSSTAGTTYSVGVGDGTPYNDALIFISNTTQYAFMNSSGNWGYGFAGTPGSRLSVSGGLSLGSSYVTIAAPTNGAIIEGNVGIGTTAPTYTLDANGTLRAGPATIPATATGGTITSSGGYTIHTFTSSGTFIPNGATNVEVLAVAGGGGGGGNIAATVGGGGGGAGGVVYTASTAVAAQSYTVTVGAGGSGGTYGTSVPTAGSNSSFSTITAAGGGRGGQGGVSGNLAGGDGGSGGGAGYNSAVGSASPAGQGNNGGPGNTGTNQPGGGGGGAGAVGGTATATVAGSGGAGSAYSISGASVTYGGGGGGSTYNGGTAGSGGAGGGGAGGVDGAQGAAGTANTGGGGGAGGATGGNGGSGIVIIRYLTSTTVTNPTIATDTNGNVGIGTTSPVGLLQVGLSTNPGLLVTPYGNVGIGTTNPTELLDITGATGGISIGPAGFQGGLFYASDGTIQIASRNNEDIKFTNSKAGATVMYMDMSAGNLGIGTTNPSYKLHLYGNISDWVRTHIQNASATGYSYFELENNAGTAGMFLGGSSATDYGGSNSLNIWNALNAPISFYTNNSATPKMVIAAAGNVGIGTTNPGHKLDVVGTAGLSTGTLWTNTSDARVKQNIETIPNALAVLAQLRPTQFMYTQSYLTNHPEIPDIEHYGFIAQEFQQVFPDSVSMSPEGFYQVNASNVIPYAIKAIQEQQAEITGILARVSDLEADVAGVATSSGELDDLVAESASSSASYFSSVEISQSLKALDATISGTFKALGESFLGNTTIAGDLIVDGTLSFTGNSISSIGTLFLQNGPLDTLIDIFNGKVQIDNSGKVSMQKLAVSSDVLGTAVIPAGEDLIVIDTDQVASNSAIFITPKSSTAGQSLYVTSQTPGVGFSIGIDNPVNHDINFNWWIVDSIIND